MFYFFFLECLRVVLIDFPHTYIGVLCGSVLKCLTHNPGLLGLNRSGSSGVFCGSVLGQDISEPLSLVLVKPRKDVNNVSCCRYMTEIPLKAA